MSHGRINLVITLTNGLLSGAWEGTDYKDVEITTATDIHAARIYVYNVNYQGKQCQELQLNYTIYTGNAEEDNSQCFYSIEGHIGYIVNEEDPETSNSSYNYLKVKVDLDELGEVDYNKEYKYTSYILKPVVATWYNALRRIALVGLLSVLVYIGIRIVLSSTSAKDKAKYKNMLKDWLVALCILFTLHYIMNITITVVDKINEVFEASVIGEDGEDVLMSTLRNDIAEGDDWGTVIVQVVLYCVLTVFTITFSIQYIRRTIYIAFLTMIAPLITLTYPLDKIKDNKSQAFDMWIKDYVFFSLLQVVHLLLYYILVASSMDLAESKNWVFAIVTIGFLTKAEKIVKKMFGFEKSKSMGALAAGATGALVMNAINKLPHGSGAKGSKDQGGAQEGALNGVRTASNNPLSTLQGGAGSSGGGSPTPGSTSGTTPSPTTGSGASAGGATKPKKNIIGGMTALGKRYMGPALGKVAGGFLGGAGAMVGFAAGVAQGDLGAALTGAMAGGTAGYGLGQRGVNAVTNIKNPREKIDEITDIWKEGAYGKEYAQNEKFDREFRRSETYKALKENPNFSEASVQAMLESGITEKRAMEKILNNSGGNINDAIGYYTLAQKCPDSVYYDDAKLQMYLEDLGLSETNAKTMRDNMKKYR